MDRKTVTQRNVTENEHDEMSKRDVTEIDRKR